METSLTQSMDNLGEEKGLGILSLKSAGTGCAVHVSRVLNSDQAIRKPFPRQNLGLSVTSFLE